MLSSPPTTHAAITSTGVPTLHVITRAFRKTPVPMTSPMTIDVAASRPSPRTSDRVPRPSSEINRHDLVHVHRRYLDRDDAAGLNDRERGAGREQPYVRGPRAGRQAHAHGQRSHRNRLSQRALHHHRVRQVDEVDGHRLPLPPE